jgi:threonine/homoserine/homoserine lactone efflux protein
MLGTQELWLFAVTVFVLNATPGVDLLFTLTRTLSGGVRGGIAASLGIGAGCVLHALAAAFGLAALLSASTAAFSVIKWVGAAYLLWLGIGMLRAAARSAAAGAGLQSGASATALAVFRQGLLTNLLNPKIALFFLALLPQFIATDAPHKTAAFLFLGAWFVIQGTLFNLLLVLAVAPLRRWRPRPALQRSLQATGGLLFAALAARLALTQRVG